MEHIIRVREMEEQSFHISVAKGSSSRLHGHDFLEFSYITKGCMRHKIGNQTDLLTAGDYFIVDHGTEHTYESDTDAPLEVVNLLFYPEFLEQTLAGRRRFEDVVNSYLLRFRYRMLRSSPTGKAFRDSDGQIRSILERILREYAEKESGYLEYIRCLFLEILIQTMRKIGVNEDAAEQSPVIAQVVGAVNADYPRKLRLSDFAEKYHYSVSYLSRRFREELGMGFSEYVQKIRMEQACRLLEETALSVEEVARQVGYENLKFFNKIFRQSLGITPREYRKSRR